MTPEIYVSVDIETDGPIPGIYSMLSLGATAGGRNFYIPIKPISTNYLPAALAVSKLDRDDLIRNASTPEDAMKSFRDWLASLGGKPVFVSFSTWDWSFVYYYLIHYGGYSPFGHSSLDMKSYYMGKYGTTWRETGKYMIARQRPHLLEDQAKHTHHALDDAREQNDFFQRIRWEAKESDVLDE